MDLANINSYVNALIPEMFFLSIYMNPFPFTHTLPGNTGVLVIDFYF